MRLRVAEFLPDLVVLGALSVLFVEANDFHDGFGILSLLLLGHTLLCEHPLPFFRQTLRRVSNDTCNRFTLGCRILFPVTANSIGHVP